MRKWLPLVIVLVSVQALSACGGSSEPPAADTSTDIGTLEETKLPSGLVASDYPNAIKWLRGRLDACGADEPQDEAADADAVWGCVDDGAIAACGKWFDANVDSVNCVEDMRYLASEALRSESARPTSKALPPEPPPTQPIAQQQPRSCFWSKGRRRWCLDAYETDYLNDWMNDGEYDESWEITQYEGDSRYYVYDHKDWVEGYLRPATIPGAWRAHVFTCLDPPPKAWRKQGCGYVRDGIAIPASRNVLRIYTKGRMVGTARGPGRVGVAAYKLVKGDM